MIYDHNGNTITFMDIRTYWQSLTPKQKKTFAHKASTSVNYIKCHLVRDPPTRIPRPPLYKALIKASGGKISYQAMFRYFYDSELSRNGKSKNI